MASTATNENTAPACLAAAEEALRQTENSHFSELKSFAKPPPAVLTIFEGVGILLDPSKKAWEWTDEKMLISGGKNQFLERLFKLDKDTINNDQLEKLKSILDRDDCQPASLARISSLLSKLGSWLRAVFTYATQRQAVH